MIQLKNSTTAFSEQKYLSYRSNELNFIRT